MLNMDRQEERARVIAQELEMMIEEQVLQTIGEGNKI